MELLVFTPYGNTEGVYHPVAPFEGFPAYRHSSGSPYLYKLFGEHWAIGNVLGGDSEVFHLVEDSPVESPELTEWPGNVEVIIAPKVDTKNAPLYLRSKSTYDNLDGGYERMKKEFDKYPAYYNPDDKMYIWHSRLEKSWYVSNELGGDIAFNQAESDIVDPSKVPSNLWEKQPFELEQITWEGVEEDDGFFDFKFPADMTSTGLKRKEGPAQWIRATNLDRESTAPEKLFDGVHPNDCLQGGTGNCWLIAAIASVAEFPRAIKDLFEPKTISKVGKYTVSLFDVRTSTWKKLPMDDFIPCERREAWEAQATPLFSKPDSGELWVLLLEKAFAKLLGSYAGLVGGQTSWAWQCLTGVEQQVWFNRQRDGWHKFVVKPKKQRKMMKEDRRACPFYPVDGVLLTDADIFKLIREYDNRNYPMSASIPSKPGEIEHHRSDGLVEGHAYSLLRVEHIKFKDRDFRLVQLRNPWGKLEWTGAWSDGSKEWAANPDVARKVNYTDEPDGLFWMSLQDFCSSFGNIYVSPSSMPSKKGEMPPKAKVGKAAQPGRAPLAGAAPLRGLGAPAGTPSGAGKAAKDARGARGAKGSPLQPPRALVRRESAPRLQERAEDTGGSSRRRFSVLVPLRG